MLEGRIVVKEGRIIVSEGRIIVSEGRIIVSEGRIIVSEGRIIVLEGRIIVLEGRIIVLEGQIVASEGQIVVSEARTDALERHVEALPGIDTLAGAVLIQRLCSHTPPRDRDTADRCALSVSTSTGWEGRSPSKKATGSARTCPTTWPARRRGARRELSTRVRAKEPQVHIERVRAILLALESPPGRALREAGA